MADMGTPGAAGLTDANSVHAAAVAFSQAAGGRMKAADDAVVSAKATLAAVKEAVAARAEATEANVILGAANAAVNGAQPSQRWYWIAAAALAVVVAAGVVWHFV